MTATKKQTKRKQLVRGRDWHAWVWKSDEGGFMLFAVLCRGCERNFRRGVKGRWTRVLFVEVSAVKKGE